MTPESFCYWLQGFFELQNPKTITPEQAEVIKEHLALVFTKVTESKVSGDGVVVDSFEGKAQKSSVGRFVTTIKAPTKVKERILAQAECLAKSMKESRADIKGPDSQEPKEIKSQRITVKHKHVYPVTYC